jgi:hypothetical protein
MIKRCGVKLLFGNAMSNWGIINDTAVGIILEPYHFAKSAGSLCLYFDDHYETK